MCDISDTITIAAVDADADAVERSEIVSDTLKCY